MKKKQNQLLILIKKGDYSFDEAYIIWCKSKADAKYQYERRVEKNGWYADEAYFVNENEKLPVEKWEKSRQRREEKHEKERREEAEKREFERLKKKYDQPN